MLGLLIGIHIFVCVLLIVSILMQASKGGGLAGGMFGGGSSMGGVFGGRGAATFLSKVSLWLGIAFGVTSLTIALLSVKLTSRPRSVVQEALQRENTVSPASTLPTVPGPKSQPAEPTRTPEQK